MHTSHRDLSTPHQQCRPARPSLPTRHRPHTVVALIVGPGYSCGNHDPRIPERRSTCRCTFIDSPENQSGTSCLRTGFNDCGNYGGLAPRRVSARTNRNPRCYGKPSLECQTKKSDSAPTGSSCSPREFTDALRHPRNDAREDNPRRCRLDPHVLESHVRALSRDR